MAPIFMATDANRAPCWHKQTGNSLEQGTFASAPWAKHHHAITTRNVKRYMIKHQPAAKLDSQS
jgi:hypothetical protein